MKDRGGAQKPGFSNGWLQGLIRRFEYFTNSIPRKSPGIDEVNLEIEKLKAVIAEYDPEDVWNCDEIGVWWKKFPKRGDSLNECYEKKGETYSRINLMFCCNANGSDKFKPWFVGKQESYACFGENNKLLDGLWGEWSSGTKTSMDSKLMMKWLLSFNKYIKAGGRSVLLLMNNHPSHVKAERFLREGNLLSHVKVHFLPPNTTSKLSPLDQGIIKTFKCGYAKRWLNFLLRCSEKGIDPTIRVTMYDALIWSIRAWRNVTSECIHHCWRHTGLLSLLEDFSEGPPNNEMNRRAIEALLAREVDDSTDSPSLSKVPNLTEAEQEVGSLLMQIHRLNTSANPLTAEEYLESIQDPKPHYVPEENDSGDDDIDPEIMRGEIMGIDRSDSNDQEDEDDAYVGQMNTYEPIYGHKEAVEKIDWILKYMEEHEIDLKTNSRSSYLLQLRSNAIRLHDLRCKQTYVNRRAR